MSRRVSITRIAQKAARAGKRGVTAPLKGGAVHSRYDQLQPLPSSPPDWQTGPPDYVIIGAQKSGTTWWQGLVEGHLQVVRPPGQRMELHFFDHFWDRWPTPDQFEHYKRYFPRPAGSLAGEKTPGYLYQPWVAPMLAHVAPDAKLIVVMRDPVDRYISGLGLLKRSGSLKGEPGAGEVGMREHRIVEAIDRSCYAEQLTWWFKHFPREHVLLLQYERCVADTQGQLDATYEFLRLESRRVPAAEVARARKKAPDHVTVAPQIRRLLASYFSDDVARLQEFMPDLDVSLWKSLGPEG
jgi:hypothetical protein